MRSRAGNWASSGSLVGTAEILLGTPTDDGTPMSVYSNDTVRWPTGLHSLDIRYEDFGGIVAHTSTVFLPVIKAVTGKP